MTTTDMSEWLLRGHAAASIAFNDPVWSAQTHAMDRGERARGDYDPPVPAQLVDTVRDRQKRLNALEDLMLVRGRSEDPPLDLRCAWTAPHESLLLAGRPLARHGITWVPASLMTEFQALYDTPLPASAEQRG